MLTQEKDTDECGEDRRKILNRNRRCQGHALQGDEKGEERQGAKGAARDEKGMIITLPIHPSTSDLQAADQSRNQAAKEDNLHRRNAIELFDEDIHDRKGEGGQQHVACPAT